MEKQEPSAFAGILGALIIIGILIFLVKLFKRKGDDYPNLIKYNNDDIENQSSITQKIKDGYQWDNKNDFLRDYYVSLIGKRDWTIWLYGFVVPILVLATAYIQYGILKEGAYSNKVIEAVYNFYIIYCSLVAVVGLFFFFGKTWARNIIFFVPFIGAFIYSVIMNGILTKDSISKLVAEMIGESILPLIIYAVIISSSVPNKAFFKIPVTYSQTQRYWNAVSNRYARYTITIGILFPIIIVLFMMPFFSYGILEKGSSTVKILFTISSVLSLIFVGWLCHKAFDSYAPEKTPPILGRGYAITGVIAAAAWVVFYLKIL